MHDLLNGMANMCKLVYSVHIARVSAITPTLTYLITIGMFIIIFLGLCRVNLTDLLKTLKSQLFKDFAMVNTAMLSNIVSQSARSFFLSHTSILNQQK